MVLTREQFARLERAIRARKARLQVEIPELDAALTRMADATYGVCCDCGGDIDFERLIVHPGALRCFDCQDFYERTSSHPAAPEW